MTAPWIAAFVAVATLSAITAVLVLGLLRRLSVILEGIDGHLTASVSHGGVLIGSRVPRFEVEGLSGDSLDSTTILTGAGIYLFLSEACAPCRELMDEIRSEGRSPTTAPLVAIVQGNGDLLQARSSGLRFYKDRSAFEHLGISTTPFAMAIDGDGRVVATTVPTRESLRELGRQVEEGVMAETSK